MSKKGTKALASATLMSLVLTTALNAGPVKAAQGSVTRIGEADRYATAASVATKNWTTSDNVVLVSGEGYADAVSASALAKKLDAPILLTSAGSLSTDTANALKTLKAKNIYIVGGNASVSQSVRDSLKASYTLIELGGSNRYETNAAVAQKLVDLGVKADNVIMVGGEGFSDALSVAPVAAAKGQILLLGMNDANYMKPVLDFVAKNKSKVTVVGTKNVISDSILSQVNGTRVDGGSDRWDTNLKVLDAFKSDLKMDKLYVASASYNAKDDGYADALVASALAGKTASPLVLVDKDGATGTNNAVSYIGKNATKTTDLNVVGGTGVVSSGVVDSINKAVSPSGGPVTVGSIEATNLNQIKIHFNCAVDSDSAEDVTNYKIDGTQLKPQSNGKFKDSNEAVAKAVDDNTVVITLATPRKQYDNVKVTVKKSIFTADKSNTVDGAEQTVTFKDLESPTLKKVTVEGNSQLTVEFSEAVDMETISKLKDKFKIDGQNLGNVNTIYSKIKNSITDSNGKVWAFKVLFYFDAPMGTGDHTLKISDADSNSTLCDAAGFPFKETTQNFSVDSVSTKPEVKSIKETTNGEVHITFDRPMDVQTALEPKNWELNQTNLGSHGLTRDNNFDTDDNDCTIKITGLSDLIKTGANTLYIKNNIKDAYGNKVADDTRKNFDDIQDNTKPTVNSVTMVDSETIFVKFSKNVDFNYATNISNYKLEDSKNSNITDHIKPNTKNADGTWDRGIYSYKGMNDTSNTDTYVIKMQKHNPKDDNDDWRLTGSKYTLTIKNVQDTASKPNVMDEKSFTLSGTDTIAPKATGTYGKVLANRGNSDKDKVIIYFTEPMDTSTLTNRDNYQFKNGEGDNVALPTDASISSGGDSKSAIIEFPSAYHVILDSVTKNISLDNNTNSVYGVTVSNVKDEAGNVLDGKAFNNNNNIATPKAGASVKDKSIKVRYENDDLKVDVQFTKSIDKYNADDFTLGGVAPTTMTTDGDKATLTFKDGALATTADKQKSNMSSITYANGKVNDNPTKIDLVKAQGQSAKLAITATTTTDETGAPVCTDVDGKPVPVSDSLATIYDYTAAPKTAYDYDDANDVKQTLWSATKDANGGQIYMTFDTPIYPNSGITTDDFAFSAGGTDIKPDSIEVKGSTIIFKVNNTNSNFGSFTGKLQVSVKSSASVTGYRDADGNYPKYVPSSDDLTRRTVNITDNTPTNVDVTGVTVDTTASVQVGGTKTLVATVTPTNATNKTVTWTSSDNTVATVDATGKVTGVKAGTATITATAGTKTATCVVTVTPSGTITTTLGVDSTTLPGFTMLKISYDGMKSADTVKYDNMAATWSVKYGCFAVKFDGTKTLADFDASKVSVVQN